MWVLLTVVPPRGLPRWETVDMAALKPFIPDMDCGLTARLQKTVRDNYIEGIVKVNKWLSGAEGPKSVQPGDTVWVAKWFLDAADKENFAWDKGVVAGGSKKSEAG